MSNSALITELRKKALETLEESSALFDAAAILRKDGKREEAKQLQELARQKRSESTWLMAEANRLHKDQSPAVSSSSVQLSK
jgi:hypothetical protein